MKKNKKKRSVVRIFISIFSVLGFLGCTIALLYPVISDRWNRYRDMQLITNYNEKISNLSEDDYTDIINSANEYNKKLRMKGKETVTDKEYAPDEYYVKFNWYRNDGVYRNTVYRGKGANISLFY